MRGLRKVKSRAVNPNPRTCAVPPVTEAPVKVEVIVPYELGTSTITVKQDTAIPIKKKNEEKKNKPQTKYNN
jgi:hypothetical protein